MVALVVIGVYAGVGAWVWGMEVLEYVGTKTGAWELSHVPVAGALLPEKTSERVGPRWMPGFGLRADQRRQEDEADFLLQRATFAVDGALAAGDPGERQRAIASASLAERTLADVPLTQLKAWCDEAKRLFAEYDRHKHQLFEKEENGQVGASAERGGELALVDPADQASSKELLDQVEGVIAKIMPWPTGVDGVIYDLRTGLGTDAQGRSILIRGVYASKVAIQIGVVVALLSVLVGAVLGAAAAYFGGWVDHVVTWLYSTLSSLPQLVLLALIAFLFIGSTFEQTLLPVYVALCLTFWIGPCRVVRGEVLKIKELEYAQAATVIGFSRPYILGKHVLPNTLHLVFINFSLLFIGAIKSEVVLTFLGLGVKDGSSWGIMISQAAPEVINGFFWQIGTATVLMLVLVLAFNVVSDTLQDAFDPKHVG